MNNVEFERLLSHKVEHICIRDLIFNYYEQLVTCDMANIKTKLHTDELFKIFVNRKM